MCRETPWPPPSSLRGSGPALMAVRSCLCPFGEERALRGSVLLQPTNVQAKLPFPGIHLPGAHLVHCGQLYAVTKMKRSPLTLTQAD